MVSIILLICVFLFFVGFEHLAEWGRMRKKKLLENDPCGNPNINKKPWDYM
jgi:hypothetical protein